jgi:hypothetical protein
MGNTVPTDRKTQATEAGSLTPRIGRELRTVQILLDSAELSLRCHLESRYAVAVGALEDELLDIGLAG